LSWRTPSSPDIISNLAVLRACEITKDRSHFDQIDRKSGKSNLGSVALRQIGRKSVASRPSSASLSEARKPSFDHSLGVARFRSCSHQPPSTRARDLSGWPSASFQLGLSAAAAACSTLVSFRSFRSFPAPALLKSCRALKPADPTYHHLVRAPYPFRHPSSSPPKSSLASLYIKVICTLLHALEQHPQPRAPYLTSPLHDKSKCAAACC
jgi:hypothetical protein